MNSSARPIDRRLATTPRGADPSKTVQVVIPLPGNELRRVELTERAARRWKELTKLGEGLRAHRDSWGQYSLPITYIQSVYAGGHGPNFALTGVPGGGNQSFEKVINSMWAVLQENEAPFCIRDLADFRDKQFFCIRNDKVVPVQVIHESRDAYVIEPE